MSNWTVEEIPEESAVLAEVRFLRYIGFGCISNDSFECFSIVAGTYCRIVDRGGKSVVYLAHTPAKTLRVPDGSESLSASANEGNQRLLAQSAVLSIESCSWFYFGELDENI